MSTNPQARYVQGNILGHLIQAAAASSVGMLAIFLVDLADLYFISLLGVPQLAAAVGFSGMLFFLAASIGMALSVAASTLVSQALGQNNPEKASQYFLDVTVFALGLGIVVTVILHLCAPSLLSLLGARGEVHDMALTYFRIVNYSLPLLLLGMTSGAGLRASGAPGLSMRSTLWSGAVNALLDPLFIFGLWVIPGMGLDGAALATVCSRIALLLASGYGAVVTKQLLRGARIARVPHSFGPVLGIAFPSLVTSLSTPIGSAFVTNRLAVYGDEVIAGVSVFGRILPLAFVGLFTLTMALSPVVGQNFGAQQYDRIRLALRDAAILSFAYGIPVAAILALSASALADLFHLSGDAAEVFYFYCRVMAFTYGFYGLHLAATQTFTNIGHPTWSTIANLVRDLLFMVPLVLWLGSTANGVLIGQYGATILNGTLAMAVAWIVVGKLGRSAASSQAPTVTTGKFHRPVTPHSVVRGH